ncbi:MAG: biotin--[acetyl-CoA-carboxylase] ligase [Elusimicrobia bacterium]|nr:biotin--[acetyl-CoA-carboxylase] ligase [Elusimicrobiota bacterium]
MMVVSELYQVSLRLPTELPWITVAKYFDRIESTQNRIVQFLPKSGDGAVMVIAETQTKGVGREGRPWVSAAGGLWFTVALPLKTLSLGQAASFSTVAALQVAEALQEVNNLKCNVKWPNDVLYEGKKLAGILLTTITKSKKPWMLVGVGINVNNSLPAELAATATSISAIRKQSQGRSRLLEAVLSSIHTAWEEFDKTGFGPYHKAVEERMVGIGKPVQIKVGSKTLEGTMKAIDAQGNLLLESSAGTKTVQAGEIVGQPA